MWRKSIFFILFLLLPFTVKAIEVQPWFGDVYEFNFLSKYAYTHFSHVDGAITPLASPSNDNLLYFDLEFPFSPQWSVDVDLQFIDTPRQSFSYSTTATQFRYLWLDDIVGDFMSLATGASVRFASERSIKDISSLIHGSVAFLANLSIGKEIDYFEYWHFRIWAYGGIGVANKGSPWINGIIGLEGNYDEKHKFGIFVDAMHGYGKNHTIDISNFNGYGVVRQKSVDIGFRYGLQLGVFGTIRAEYIRRLDAKLCPSNVNTFVASYLLPFSF
jgi:hypothetical protein